MTDAAVSSSDENVIITYHCLCSQLLAGTRTPLENLPRRQLDGSHIAVPGDFGKNASATIAIQNMLVDPKATIITLEDGFEKRYLVKCGRCGLLTGYHLDRSQFVDTQSGIKDDVLYILSGSLDPTHKLRQAA